MSPSIAAFAETLALIAEHSPVRRACAELDTQTEFEELAMHSVRGDEAEDLEPNEE